MSNITTANPEYLKAIRHVAVYVRKSRVGQDESEFVALEKHRRQLLDFVEKHKMEYTLFEEVVSGTSIERTEFNKMLNVVKLGAVDGIVVINWDRLGRNELDGILLRQALQDTETLVVQLDPFEIINLNNDGDMDKSAMMTFFAAWEARQIKRRLKAGKIRGALLGKWVNPTIPFGYVRDKSTGFLVINEPQAAVFRRIVETFIGGKQTKAICYELNRDNVPSPKGGVWNDSVVRRMMIDPVYIGTATYGKALYKSNGAVIPQAVENQIIVENAHPAIINQATHDRIIDLIGTRKRIHTTAQNGNHILSGLLKCQVCGAGLNFARTDAGVWVRHCQAVNPLGDKCTNTDKGVAVEVITKEIANILKTRKEKYLAPTNDNGAEAEFAANVKKLEAEINKLSKALERILDLYEMGEIDKATYTERKTKRTAERDELQRQLVKIQAAGLMEASAKERIEAIDEVVALIEQNDGKNSKKINQGLRSIIHSIIYKRPNKNELTLDIKYL